MPRSKTSDIYRAFSTNSGELPSAIRFENRPSLDPRLRRIEQSEQVADRAGTHTAKHVSSDRRIACDEGTVMRWNDISAST